jgi:ABC-2 type transport system ATP-binding protein
LAVIHLGKVVAEGTVDEIRAKIGGESRLMITVDRPDLALTTLADFPKVKVVGGTGSEIELLADPTHTAQINRRLVEAGVDVSELRPLRHSLEEAFLGLTGAPQTRMEQLEVAR